MLPYILAFGFSILLFFFSTRVKSNFLKTLFVAIAIFIPCLLAGLRATSIGTDTSSYLKMYNAACTSDGFSDFTDSTIVGGRYIKDFESGFTIIVYVLKLFDSPQIFLFVLELLIMLPLYLGCRKIKSLDDHIWLCMAIYYFLFFNMSLNITREFIASALAFLGICILLSDEKRPLLKCLTTIVLAISVHRSAILSLLVVIAFLLFKQNKMTFFRLGRIGITSRTIKIVMVLLVLVVLLMNASTIGNFLFSIDGFGRYSVYYNGDISFSTYFFFEQAPILAIFAFSLRDFLKKQKNAAVYMVIFALAIVFGLLGHSTLYGDRISNVFKMFYIVLLPLSALSARTKLRRNMVTGGLLSYIVLYWFIMYVVQGYTATVPYILMGAGI